AAYGCGAGCAVAEPDQQVRLVLDIDVDGNAAVSLRIARRAWTLPCAATPDAPFLVRRKLGGKLADAFARDMLDQVEPMDADIHHRVAAPDAAGREMPHIFLRVETVIRQIAPADAPQCAELATSHALPQHLHERVAPVIVGDRADAAGCVRRLD